MPTSTIQVVTDVASIDASGSTSTASRYIRDVLPGRINRLLNPEEGSLILKGSSCHQSPKMISFSLRAARPVGPQSPKATPTPYQTNIHAPKSMTINLNPIFNLPHGDINTANVKELKGDFLQNPGRGDQVDSSEHKFPGRYTIPNDAPTIGSPDHTLIHSDESKPQRLSTRFEQISRLEIPFRNNTVSTVLLRARRKLCWHIIQRLTAIGLQLVIQNPPGPLRIEYILLTLKLNQGGSEGAAVEIAKYVPEGEIVEEGISGVQIERHGIRWATTKRELRTQYNLVAFFKPENRLKALFEIRWAYALDATHKVSEDNSDNRTRERMKHTSIEHHFEIADHWAADPSSIILRTLACAALLLLVVSIGLLMHSVPDTYLQ